MRLDSGGGRRVKQRWAEYETRIRIRSRGFVYCRGPPLFWGQHQDFCLDVHIQIQSYEASNFAEESEETVFDIIAWKSLGTSHTSIPLARGLSYSYTGRPGPI